MGFRVNTNLSSLQAQRPLKTVVRETHESSAKLASGERITKAADDAAGLAISEKMKAEIRSSRQANRNANDGLSLVQVAEGGLNESSSILTRMRELAIQSASDHMSDSERAMSDREYQAFKEELNRLAQVTEFNGKKLLNGSSHQLDFQVGVGSNSADDQISFNTNSVNASTASLGVAHLSISSKYGAQQSLGTIDRAIDKVSGHRALLGSIQNRLQTSSNNLGIYVQNMSFSNSQIRDVDYALETANQARNSIITQTSTAVLAQANTQGQNALKLV